MSAALPRRSSPLERRRRLGRRVGAAVFGVIFAAATAVWAVEILMVVWGSAPPSPAGCQAGTAGLERALTRARSEYVAGSGDEDERAALARFRGALQPEWSEEKAVLAACKGDGPGRARLRELIALRYAEEHAVRYESLGLAPQRRRLQQTSAAPRSESIR